DDADVLAFQRAHVVRSRARGVAERRSRVRAFAARVESAREEARRLGRRLERLFELLRARERLGETRPGEVLLARRTELERAEPEGAAPVRLRPAEVVGLHRVLRPSRLPLAFGGLERAPRAVVRGIAARREPERFARGLLRDVRVLAVAEVREQFALLGRHL